MAEHAMALNTPEAWIPPGGSGIFVIGSDCPVVFSESEMRTCLVEDLANDNPGCTATQDPAIERLSTRTIIKDSYAWQIIYNATCDASGNVAATRLTCAAGSIGEFDPSLGRRGFNCNQIEYFISPELNRQCEKEGNPCDPSTGNKTQIEEDLVLNKIGLSLKRYYQSQSTEDSFQALGRKWRINYSQQMDSGTNPASYASAPIIKSALYYSPEVACIFGWGDIKGDAFYSALQNATAEYENGLCKIKNSSGEVASTLRVHPDAFAETTSLNPIYHSVSRPDGTLYIFEDQSGEWVPTTNAPVKLIEVGDNWHFTDLSDNIEVYDSDGKLLSITARNGLVTTLSYAPNNTLNMVTGPYGHTLIFTYDTNNRIESVATPLGDTGYRYDANNNLEFVDNPDGTTKQYHYENNSYISHLTGITDEDGIRYATWDYDDKGRAIVSEHAGGVERVELAYKSNFSTTTITNSRGSERVYQFKMTGGQLQVDSVSGVPCLTCINGEMKDRTYDANGYLANSSNWQDVITKYGQYDTKGQYGCKVEGVTASDASAGACAFDLAASPNARRTDYVYDVRFFDRITSMTERSVKAGNYKVTTSVYDAFGNRLSETVAGFDVLGNPVTRTSTFEYDGPLNQLSLMDGPRTDASDLTHYRYYANDAIEGNNRARLKEVEDANGNLIRVSIEYTTTGKVESESRPNDLSLGYLYYPGNDRLQSLTESDSSGDTRVTQWTYLPTGEVESITTGVGTLSSTTLTLGYDDARRLARITDGLGHYVEYGLDTEGNRETETTYDANGTPSNFADDVLKKQITQTFDVYNRLDTTSQANETQNLTFAPDGTLDTQTDGNSTVTDYSYDALKRLTQTIQDQGGSNTQTKDATTVYGYDVADRLTSVTDPINGNTTYQYDDLGNLLSQTSPDTGTMLYLYDNAGNLTQKTDAKGQVITYAYDALNRLTSVDAVGSEDDLTYTYDSCANGTNRLCTVQSATQTVHTTYDAFGEVIRSQGMTSTYVADKLDSMTYPSGARVSYTYDLAGQITQLNLTQSGTTETIVSNVTYAPLGPIEQLTFGNGLVLTQSPDSAYRMVDQSIPGVLTLDTILFDPNGNVTTRNETVGSTGLTNNTYTYDEINRLHNATGAFGTQSLVYDKNGNRTQDSLNSQVTPYTYEPNSNRIAQLNAVPVTIDANGNTEAQNNYTYAYTSHSRLKTATESTTLKASFTYNGLGQRNHKTNNQTAEEKYFFYGATGELLAETDAHGNVLTEYIYLNGILITQYEPDSDQDGQTNTEEAKLGTNPINTDTDSDGLTDLTELLQTGTNTNEADTDQDGSTDNEEIIAGTDPLNAASLPVINPPSTPVAAPGLQTIALVGLSTLLLTFGAIFAKRGHQTPAVFFTIISLLILPNQYSLIGNVQAEPAISGQLYFVHTDQLGTPRVMTDRNATVVWQAAYDPFGKATIDEDPDNDGKVVKNNIRFPGQYFDEETGGHYNYFRYYDPETGRYLTSDPIGLQGGPNTYTYVYNNPTRWIDPLGLDVTTCLYSGVPPHIGMGVNSSATTGRRTDGTSNLIDIISGEDVPGEVSRDSGTPSSCTTTSTTSEQDEQIQQYIDDQIKNPGPYNLYGRSCVDYVRDPFEQILGIPLSNSNLPTNIYRDIFFNNNR